MRKNIEKLNNQLLTENERKILFENCGKRQLIEQKFISKGGFVHCHSLSVLKLGKRGNAGKTTPAKILRELAKVKVDDLDDINMNEGLKLLSAVYDTSSKELRKEK